MSTSPNLGITHLTQGQNQKHATVNAGFDRIDNAQHASLDVEMAATGDTLISLVDFQDNGRFDLVDLITTISANVTISVPAAPNRLFRMRNSTGAGPTYTVTLQVTGGAGVKVVLPADVWGLFYTDGTDIEEIGFTGNTSNLFLAAQKVKTISYSATTGALTPDFEATAVYEIDMDTNLVLNNPSPAPGTNESATFELILTQDVGGSNTLDTTASKYAFAGGVNPVLTTAGGAIDRIIFTYDSTNDLWHGTFIPDSK
jgi:hypothetical protein